MPLLRRKLSKPLLPIWVTRDSVLPQEKPNFPDFHPIVLCTASRLIHGAEMSEAGYIQGAGDDNEGWSQGLDPQIFWSNKEQLLSTAEEDLPEMIEQLLKRHQHADNLVLPTVIAPTDWLFIASRSALHESSMDHFTHIIFCEKTLDKAIDVQHTAKCLHLHCRKGKLGSRDLRKELTKVLEFLMSSMPHKRVLVSCHDGKDISIGVALTVLCQFADDNGKLLGSMPKSARIDKDFIRRRLSWIMISLPSSKPLRTTLQSVNDFLLKSPQGNSTPSLQSLERKNMFHDLVERTFIGLTGKWQMTRVITNSLQAGPSGDVNGFVIFERREPTSEEAKAEYLYTESGTFTITQGPKMSVKRRWLWRFSKQGSISVHFVNIDGHSEDYLYHVLSFDEQTDKDDHHTLVAHGDHACGEDHYNSTYEFFLESSKEGSQLSKFIVRHLVHGPEKDYISESRYHRHMEDTAT